LFCFFHIYMHPVCIMETLILSKIEFAFFVIFCKTWQRSSWSLLYSSCKSNYLFAIRVYQH
jgi:hypothetical protein